ncbi:MAG: HAMP domain-containing sensor histidine kinase [Nannocystaceae bacterium]|nr:HAMP domain-containing histidine kinase [Myxococcales bacterium]
MAAYVEAGLSAEQLRDPDVLHRVRLTAFIAVTAGALTLLLVPSAMIAAVAPASGAAVAGCLVSAGLHLIAPLVLRATRSLAVTAHLFAGHVFAGLALSTLLAGGLRSPTLVAAPVVVPLAMLIGGRRAGVLWALVICLYLGGLYAAERAGLVPIDMVKEEGWTTAALASAVGVVAGIVWLLAQHDVLRSRALARERRVSSKLANAEIAEREARLAAAQSEAQQVAGQTLLNTMSHELRTPLNAIIGYSEHMLECAEDGQQPREEQLESLRTIIAAGRHLVTMISDLLELSRAESEGLALKREPVELGPLIREVTRTLTPLAERKGLTVAVELAAEPRLIHTDRVQLGRALTCLLSNAIKFTGDGGVTVRSRGVGLAGASGCEIEVQDTGIGIPPERIEDVFMPFSQVDSSHTRRFGGAGLGLSLASRIVEGLGGSIQVRSELGVGSSFTIRLVD